LWWVQNIYHTFRWMFKATVLNGSH
jgi:hypothetical protein